MKITETPSLVFSGTLPSAKLLAGDKENELSLVPSKWPEVRIGKRKTFLGPATTQTWNWEFEEGFQLELVRTDLRSGGGTTLRAAISNRSGKPVRLKSISLADGGEIRRTAKGGKAAEWTLARIGRAGDDTPALWDEERLSRNEKTRRVWKSYNMPIPFELPTDDKSNDGRWRQATDGFSVTRTGGQDALVLQTVGPGEVEIAFDYHVTPDRLRMEISAEFGAVVLEHGETRFTDELLVLAGDWQGSCEKAFRWVASTHGARTGLSPIGWCSWYDLFQDVGARTAGEPVAAFRKLKDRLPLSFYQLDDGYQRTVGDWRTDPRPEKFPGGLTPFVADANSLGARPGIWIAPLAVHESSPLFKEHPEWMQKNAEGKFTSEVNNWGPVAHWMDPTHPGAQEWIRQLIREFRAMGFTYFKIDFNNLEETTRWHDPKKTRLQVYRDLYRLYREEIGEHCYLLACGAYTLRAPAGFVDAFRIGPDSGPVWEYGDYPCSIGNCVKAVVNTAPAHGILYVNDPDVTYLRARDTLLDEQVRSWHGFVGLLGGLVAVSEPMGRADFAEAAPMLQILNPPVPERGHALHGAADPAGCFFGFTAQRPYGDFAVVQIHNPGKTAADVSLETQDTGLAGKVHVWSFWDSRYHGATDGTHTARDLPPRGSQIVRLTPVSKTRPVLVGSDLHIGCGAAEVKAFAWDAKSSRLAITLDGQAGRDYGALWIATPWEIPDGPMPGALESCENISGYPFSLGDRLVIFHIKARTSGVAQKIVLTLTKPRQPKS